MNIQDFPDYFAHQFKHTSSFFTGIVFMLMDGLMIMLCVGIGFFIVNICDYSLINFKSFVSYSIYLPLIFIVFYSAGLYPGIMDDPADEVKKFAICSFFSFIGIALSITIENNNKIAISAALIIAIPFAIVLLTLGRELIRHIFGKFYWWGVPVVVYCTKNSGDFVIDRLLDYPNFGYKPALIINTAITDNKFYKNKIPVFSPGKEIENTIRSLNIKVAIICDYEEDLSDIMSSYRYTIMVSKNQTANSGSTLLKDFGGILGFLSTHFLTKKSNLILKRVLDILLILLFAWLLIPLILIISVITKFTSKGPVFYGHRRIGKNGKEFKCWKFRSMVINADEKLNAILKENPQMKKEWEKERKIENDPRVTPFGKFLRKTSLDEIPQLLNVLTGEMSLIGPRPVTKPELSKYGDKVDYILSVMPGLSGMWQISGRSDTVYEERITLDTYYIQNWSIWLDIWILIKTLWVVLKGKGAY